MGAFVWRHRARNRDQLPRSSPDMQDTTVHAAAGVQRMDEAGGSGASGCNVRRAFADSAGAQGRPLAPLKHAFRSQLDTAVAVAHCALLLVVRTVLQCLECPQKRQTQTYSTSSRYCRFSSTSPRVFNYIIDEQTAGMAVLLAGRLWPCGACCSLTKLATIWPCGHHRLAGPGTDSAAARGSTDSPQPTHCNSSRLAMKGAACNCAGVCERV